MVQRWAALLHVCQNATGHSPHSCRPAPLSCWPEMGCGVRAVRLQLSGRFGLCPTRPVLRHRFRSSRASEGNSPTLRRDDFFQVSQLRWCEPVESAKKKTDNGDGAVPRCSPLVAPVLVVQMAENLDEPGPPPELSPAGTTAAPSDDRLAATSFASSLPEIALPSPASAADRALDKD